MKPITLNKKVARRVLEVVDAGLTHGAGNPEPGKMCVEAAVNFALGLPHGDNPPCVGAAVRSFKISLNDGPWSSDTARAKGLRRIAIAQLGSNEINQVEFAKLLSLRCIQKLIPEVLRIVAPMVPGHQAALLEHAIKCEKAETLEAASAASYAASAASAKDKMLTLAADIGTDVLIGLKSPGCKWLDLCNVA